MPKGGCVLGGEGLVGGGAPAGGLNLEVSGGGLASNMLRWKIMLENHLTFRQLL